MSSSISNTFPFRFSSTVERSENGNFLNHMTKAMLDTFRDTLLEEVLNTDARDPHVVWTDDDEYKIYHLTYEQDDGPDDFSHDGVYHDAPGFSIDYSDYPYVSIYAVFLDGVHTTCEVDVRDL